MNARIGLLTAILVVCLPLAVLAQDQSDFTEWLYKRIQTLSAQGGAGTNKQVDTPSVATNSTTLVDRPGAPDLVGLAMQFFNRGQGSDKTPTSITLSAFALRAAVIGDDPLRPEVYTAGRNWRRYSFTVGREAAEEAGQPDAQLLGVKALVFDRRDPTSPSNVEQLRQMAAQSKFAARSAQALTPLYNLIATRLAPRLGVEPFAVLEEFLGKERQATTLAMLTADDLAQVDAVLTERILPLLAEAKDEQQRLVQRLARAPQLALSYQSKLREDVGNEHQWLAVFDYGVANRVSISVNGGLAIADRPELDDEASGRLAVEAQFRLTGDTSTLVGLLRTKSPLVISVAANSAWNPDVDDIHKAQVKLTLPLPGPLSGVSLPLSLTVANRTELIDEKDVRGQVGFTLDFSKLTSGLRGR